MDIYANIVITSPCCATMFINACPFQLASVKVDVTEVETGHVYKVIK